jgi:hypothetical protein
MQVFRADMAVRTVKGIADFTVQREKIAYLHGKPSKS